MQRRPGRFLAFFRDALAAGFIVEWATAPVPEPATAVLAALGLGALWLRRRC